MGGIIVIIYPILGLLPIIVMSLSSSKLLASWLGNHCPTYHLIYNIGESQAYILLWALIVKVYINQKKDRDLLYKRISTVLF